MIKHGVPPYLECSSKGDKRFSAFYAWLPLWKCTLEQKYQESKKFADGTTGKTLGWKNAKGKKAVNQEECNDFYSRLWDYYIMLHPDLIDVLITASGLSDIFGQEGHCCQATELWRIRNDFIRMENKNEDRQGN